MARWAGRRGGGASQGESAPERTTNASPSQILTCSTHGESTANETLTSEIFLAPARRSTAFTFVSSLAGSIYDTVIVCIFSSCASSRTGATSSGIACVAGDVLSTLPSRVASVESFASVSLSISPAANETPNTATSAARRRKKEAIAMPRYVFFAPFSRRTSLAISRTSPRSNFPFLSLSYLAMMAPIASLP